MLGRCSTATLYHRFHGPTNGMAYATTLLAAADTAAESDGHGDAYAAWVDGQCVGLASLHAEDGVGEVAVLVEDSWQRRGVGSLLMRALVRAARRRGLVALHADVLAPRRFLVRLLGQIGPTRTVIGGGVYGVLVGLEAA
jgi:GNAT superfamily N-acetyltransferase